MGLDINQIIKNLAQFKSINFSETDEEYKLLAAKYDKNHNSVFDSDEIKAIKNDLIKLAKENGDKAYLSEEEAEKFFKELVADNKDFQDIVNDHGSNLLNYLSQLFDYSNLLMTDISGYLEKEWPGRFNETDIWKLSELNKKQFDVAKNMMNLESNNKLLDTYSIIHLSGMDEQRRKNAIKIMESEDFSVSDACTYSVLDENELSRVKYLLNNEKLPERFTALDIAPLTKLSVEDFEKAKEWFDKKCGDGQFSSEEILDLIKLEDYQLERARKLLQSDKREFRTYDIVELAKLNEIEYEKAEQLLYNKSRNDSCNIITECAKLGEKEFKRVKELLFIEGRNEQFDLYSILELAQLSDEEFERAKKLAVYINKDKQFTFREIKLLAQFSENQFEQLANIFNNNASFNTIDIYDPMDTSRIIRVLEDISDIKYLDDELFNRLKQLLCVKGRSENEQFDGYALGRFLSLDSEKFEKVKNFLYIKDKKNSQFDANGIISLADKSDEYFKRAKLLIPVVSHVSTINSLLNNLSDEEINWTVKYVIPNLYDAIDNEIIALTKNRNSEIEKILTQNPDKKKYCRVVNKQDFFLSVETDQKYNKVYYFDKTGLAETKTTQDIDIDGYNNCCLLTIDNKKLNIKQEVKTGCTSNDEESIVVIEEKLVYLDNNGNAIKTVTLKRNPQNGALNVSRTDRFGETVPIQWESEEEDGSIIREQHLTSPDGVKTDFYNEEHENLRVTDYTITSNNDEKLINLHQTFQKISENKYISSINATGNDSDTQIYEMEYKDDYVVEIYDKKNDRKTVIDLKKYFNDDDITSQKLLPVIKQLPGHVLLEFAEKPFKLVYDNDLKLNANWNTDNNTLKAGNYSIYTDENRQLFGTITHELGHYLDFYDNLSGAISNLPEILEIYEEELKSFKASNTYEQQSHVSYFTTTGSIGGVGVIPTTTPNGERVAEAHAIMYSQNHSQTNLRRFYLAENFPRTMAAIMKHLLKEEGVKTL